MCSSDAGRHLDLKKRLRIVHSWNDIQDIVHDTVRNAEYACKDVTNPFIPNLDPLDDAGRRAEHVINGYGEVQDNECVRMMEALAQLDAKGNGRVPFSTSCAQPRSAECQFKEAAHYLQMIGPLDYASGTPQVRIAYVQGPSTVWHTRHTSPSADWLKGMAS